MNCPLCSQPTEHKKQLITYKEGGYVKIDIDYIKLRPAEMVLFEELHSKYPNVVSPNTIMDSLMFARGYLGDPPNDEILRVYASSMNKKFKGTRLRIKNEAKYGYKLEIDPAE